MHARHRVTSRSRIQPRALAIAGLCALAACGDDVASGASEEGDTGAEVIDLDRIDPTCRGARPPAPASCGDPVIESIENRGQDHVPDGTAITYVDDPPSSGDHRPAWARWGEFAFLPPQRWLHNLEHGGIAFLYDPCADEAVVSRLRAFAKAQPDDDTGPFRWVMTPYPGLQHGVAAIAWGSSWQAGCLDAATEPALQSFITEHYRKAPEDVAVDGSYATDWIGR